MSVAGLLDTSVVIALAGPQQPQLPDRAAISTMTLAELQLGAALAGDEHRSLRLRLLAYAERTFEALPVDALVAARYGQLVAAVRRAGRRLGVADALIAATALAHGLTLYSLDEVFRNVPGLDVVGI